MMLWQNPVHERAIFTPGTVRSAEPAHGIAGDRKDLFPCFVERDRREYEAYPDQRRLVKEPQNVRKGSQSDINQDSGHDPRC